MESEGNDCSLSDEGSMSLVCDNSDIYGETTIETSTPLPCLRDVTNIVPGRKLINTLHRQKDRSDSFSKQTPIRSKSYINQNESNSGVLERHQEKSSIQSAQIIPPTPSSTDEEYLSCSEVTSADNRSKSRPVSKAISANVSTDLLSDFSSLIEPDVIEGTFQDNGSILSLSEDSNDIFGDDLQLRHSVKNEEPLIGGAVQNNHNSFDSYCQHLLQTQNLARVLGSNSSKPKKVDVSLSSLTPSPGVCLIDSCEGATLETESSSKPFVPASLHISESSNSSDSLNIESSLEKLSKSTNKDQDSSIVVISDDDSFAHVTSDNHVSKRDFLLDVVINEVKMFAPCIASEEPTKHFLSRYSQLELSEKQLIHSCLFDVLDKRGHWIKYPERFKNAMDSLVSLRFFKYLSENDDLMAAISLLTRLEVKTALGYDKNKKDVDIETAKNLLAERCLLPGSEGELFRLRVCQKFVKMSPHDQFSLSMCFELLAVPLNLHDKSYKVADIARYVSGIIRDSKAGKIRLLSQKCDGALIQLKTVDGFQHFYELCKLKSEFLENNATNHRLAAIATVGASLCLYEIAGIENKSLEEEPLFKYTIASLVYILDNELTKYLTAHPSTVEIVFCLGLLLHQKAAGWPLKAEWAKKKVKFLCNLLETDPDFDWFRDLLSQNVSLIDLIVRSDFTLKSLKTRKINLSSDEKDEIESLVKIGSHKKVTLSRTVPRGAKNIYKVLTTVRKPAFTQIILSEAYGKEYPSGVQDNGVLLLNGVILVFWKVIYTNIENQFMSCFQKCPCDWGSEGFYERRKSAMDRFVKKLKKGSISSVVKRLRSTVNANSGLHSIVDWYLVSNNITDICSIISSLGLSGFIRISVYLLEHFNERMVGFPDLTIWNETESSIKFISIKKPIHHLYPHQVVWMEKLCEFGLNAEECQVVYKKS